MRIRKFGLVLLFMCASSPALADSRYQIISLGDDRAVLVDDTSLKRSGTTAVVWTAIIDIEAEYDYMLMQNEFNCSIDTMRGRYAITFKGDDVMSSTAMNKPATPIIPASIGEMIASYVCDGETPDGYEGNKVDSDRLSEIKGILQDFAAGEG